MERAIFLLALAAVALGFPQRDERIVNGQSTTIENYPYQGSLRYDGNHFCGCSLLGKRVVLTAAHCTNDPPIDLLTVHFGSTVQTESSGQVVKVKEVRQHENFKRPSMDFDVAVLILEEDIKFDLLVKPVALATTEPKTGEKAVVTGWGLLKEGTTQLPKELQKLDVPIYNRDWCNSVYGGKISKRMLCAGFEAGGKDACAGDSGGPLVSNGQQVGIVSWGNGCAHPYFVGIYTNVAEVRDWILKQSELL